MTYHQAQTFLNSFVNYERLNLYPYQTFKLARAQRFLALLGNPHRDLRVIHIAGTKGKGSTCAFLANILSRANFKVGLYTSPHLVDLRERIRILKSTEYRVQSTEKGKISQKDFSRLIAKIKPYAERLRKTTLGRLSYYEILTALAFLYFKEKKCDFVVLETGIGGRLDATNLAESLVCAITPISYEHTHVLGSTLEKIAAEKAGIIKRKAQSVKRKTEKESPGQIVVTAPQRPAALKVIRKRAKKFGARLLEVGRDIPITKLKIGLSGKHQVINASVAVGIIQALRENGIEIAQEAISAGLRETRWPGRLQVISQRPRIILDGAQNQASARALKEAIGELFKFRNLTLVFGASCDKDVRGMLRELAPCAGKIILTRADNPRAMAPEVIRARMRTNAKQVMLTQNSHQALSLARQNAGQKDLILVCGSLFLVGEILGTVPKNRDGSA